MIQRSTNVIRQIAHQMVHEKIICYDQVCPDRVLESYSAFVHAQCVLPLNVSSRDMYQTVLGVAYYHMETISLCPLLTTTTMCMIDKGMNIKQVR